MLNKVIVSTAAAMFVVMVAPAGANSVFVSDARDSGGKLDIRSYQVSHDGGALYLKQCMHDPFDDRALSNGNQLTAGIEITGATVTSSRRPIGGIGCGRR